MKKSRSLPLYGEHTSEHLKLLQDITKDIQIRGLKNINTNFNSFFSHILKRKPIDKLSSFGSKYHDWLPGCGEVDHMFGHIVKAQVDLIEVCFKNNYIPDIEWFSNYHDDKDGRQYLLDSQSLLEFVCSPQSSPEQSRWIDFIGKYHIDKKVQSSTKFEIPLEISQPPLYHLDKLPLSAKEKIEFIKKESNQLLNEKNNLSIENTLNLKEINEKIIPRLLKKYLAIDERYRADESSLDGKNAQLILNDSLSIIEEKIKTLIQEQALEKLNDLDVDKKYLEMKMK